MDLYWKGKKTTMIVTSLLGARISGAGPSFGQPITVVPAGSRFDHKEIRVHEFRNA